MKRKNSEFMKKSDEGNIWYQIIIPANMDMQKNMYGSNLIVQDSIQIYNGNLRMKTG